MTTTEPDWIDELVDWQMRNPPDVRRTCRACMATFTGEWHCPECGTHQLP